MASKDLNMHQAIGRVGNSPELRHTGNGTPVCNFSLYSNSMWTSKESGDRTEKSVRHDITVFGRKAETVCEHVKKGQELYVLSRLEYKSEKSEQGFNLQSAYLVMDEFQFLGKKAS